jgi:hypothetical protein
MSELENATRRQYIQNTNTAGTRTGDPAANLAEGEIAIVDRAGKIITVGGANPYTGNALQKEIAIVQKLDGSIDYSPWFKTSDIEVLSKEAYKAPDQQVLVLGVAGTVGRNPVWTAAETYRMSVEFEDRTRVAANRNPERYFVSTLATTSQADKLALFSDFLAQLQADNYCKKFCRAYLTANGSFVASTTAGANANSTYAFTKGSKTVTVTILGTATVGNSVIADAWWKISNNPQTNLISGAPVASSPVYKIVAASNASQVYTLTLDRPYEGETQTLTLGANAVATQITVIAAANTATVTEFGIGIVGLRQPFGERIGRHIVRVYANLGVDDINRGIRTLTESSSSTSIQEADYGAGAWETIFDMERQSMFANGSQNHGECIRIRPAFRTLENGAYSLFSIFVNSKTQRAMYTTGVAPLAMHIAINAGAGAGFETSDTTMVYFNTVLGLIAVAEKIVPDSTAWNAAYTSGGVTIAS